MTISDPSVDDFAKIQTGIEDTLFERFSLIVNAPALFNAIVTGIEVGVFDALQRDPGAELPALEAATGVQVGKLRALMLALCATGLLERRGDGYANSNLARTILTGDGPSSWRDILVGWQRIYYPAFGQLTEALRWGTNRALDAYRGDGDTLYQRLENSPETEQVLHRAMSAFTVQSLPGLLDNVGLDGARRLLDIGGGDGTTARALVRANPELAITLFDLPGVAGLAETQSADADRITVVSGNVFEDPFPGGFDAALFSHLLEVFSPEEVLQLARKAHDALRPGGRVLVYGFTPPADESDGIYSSRLALYLTALATGKGMTYPAADYEDWLREAGFTNVHTVPDLPFEHSLVVGTRRE
jgi:SAM-dependent methyltransferase